MFLLLLNSRFKRENNAENNLLLLPLPPRSATHNHMWLVTAVDGQVLVDDVQRAYYGLEEAAVNIIGLHSN